MALTDEVWLCSNKECDAAWYVKHGDMPSCKLCYACDSNIVKTPLLVEEYAYITLISEDRDFIDAMIELKQKDIIEFKTKIAQFKAQVDAQEERKRQQSNQPKCPTCQSTNIRKIGTGERVASVVGFGIFSKKINKTWKCNNCGYTW